MRLGTALGMLALVAGAGSWGSARAADMPAYGYTPASEAAADAPMTFGTGWYLRGDASFGLEDKPKLLLDSPASFDTSAKAYGYGFGLGAGYRFNEFLRVDVTADYLDPFHYAATTSCGASCSLDRTTDIERFDGLVNGYFDLGTWWGISPYVGAGAGIGGTVTDGSIRLNGLPLAAGITDPSTGTLVTSGVPTRTDYRFAWAAMAGLTYPISPHMLLDVGYRYLDFGKTAIPLFPAAGTSRDISANQVRVGVRYMID